MSNKKILVLPGDGIGVEVMQEVLNIINWMTKNKSISFDISERPLPLALKIMGVIRPPSTATATEMSTCL